MTYASIVIIVVSMGCGLGYGVQALGDADRE